MAIAKFRVVDGKCALPRAKGQSRQFAHKDDVVELEESFVAKFANKFERVPAAAPAAPPASAAAPAAVLTPKAAPQAIMLQNSLARLPGQIKKGEYKDPEYVVGAMRSHYGALFTPVIEKRVRAMFPVKPAAPSGASVPAPEKLTPAEVEARQAETA